MKRMKQINFLKAAYYLTPFSVALSFVAFITILVLGFTYGVDFSGGNEVQVRFQSEVTSEEIRDVLKDSGFEKPVVQSFGEDNEFIIRIEAMSDEESNNKNLTLITSSLQKHFKEMEIRRVDSIGPQIGKELRRNGILAVLYSLLMILIYLGLRFDAKYAPSAVFCLFHDTVITMSLFAIFQFEVNIQTLAAILAIIGYSLNDTIVTFDRIRENQTLFQNKKSFSDICNLALNDVLSRTLLTSITTLLAVGAMWFFTNGVIKDFAFTLAIGVLVGTYSSIYVATPLLILINKLKYFQK